MQKIIHFKKTSQAFCPKSWKAVDVFAHRLQSYRNAPGGGGGWSGDVWSGRRRSTKETLGERCHSGRAKGSLLSSCCSYHLLLRFPVSCCLLHSLYWLCQQKRHGWWCQKLKCSWWVAIASWPGSTFDQRKESGKHWVLINPAGARSHESMSPCFCSGSTSRMSELLVWATNLMY